MKIAVTPGDNILSLYGAGFGSESCCHLEVTYLCQFTVPVSVVKAAVTFILNKSSDRKMCGRIPLLLTFPHEMSVYGAGFGK